MSKAAHLYLSPNQLQIGMYIELDLGWMSHPFPKGSFKISSAKQIETIRGLGLKKIRFIPAKSDITPSVEALQETIAVTGEHITPENNSTLVDASCGPESPAESETSQKFGGLVKVQQIELANCERRFSEAIRLYKLVSEQVSDKPVEAMLQCKELVSALVGDLLSDGESNIRLLSEGSGDKNALHPVNVMVLSLLLGRALGLSRPELMDLGMAAFLHDVGKVQLPERVRRLGDNFLPAEYKLYQQHVAESVSFGRAMALTPGALEAVAQHHELVDGSGFPERLKVHQLSSISKILALVNRYDNLCNPARIAAAVTPHEALSMLFSQLKSRFDVTVLNAFIRMMGVYPPGSVVQLTDERFAIVMSVNSSRPLKPRILVHEPSVSKFDALILDLECESELGIRRSLRSASLPRAAYDYLTPRQRVCYFFDTTKESSADYSDA